LITFRFDCYRDGPRWTWIVEGGGENVQGGAPTERSAMQAARLMMRRIANGEPFRMEQGLAEHEDPAEREQPQQPKPRPTQADHSLWERLQAAMRRPEPAPHRAQPGPAELAELRAAMLNAHPDRGGSSAAFILAHARYEAARRAASRK
jgi:hypothetical protein